jgi:uncharacterized coiled-coil protein SlyX
METDLRQRLEVMESHLAHLERQYEQLNEVVIAQGKQLARAQTRLRGLGQTVETIELERIKSTNPKPPHYR